MSHTGADEDALTFTRTPQPGSHSQTHGNRLHKCNILCRIRRQHTRSVGQIAGFGRATEDVHAFPTSTSMFVIDAFRLDVRVRDRRLSDIDLQFVIQRQPECRKRSSAETTSNKPTLIMNKRQFLRAQSWPQTTPSAQLINSRKLHGIHACTKIFFTLAVQCRFDRVRRHVQILLRRSSHELSLHRHLQQSVHITFLLVVGMSDGALPNGEREDGPRSQGRIFLFICLLGFLCLSLARLVFLLRVRQMFIDLLGLPVVFPRTFSTSSSNVFLRASE